MHWLTELSCDTDTDQVLPREAFLSPSLPSSALLRPLHWQSGGRKEKGWGEGLGEKLRGDRGSGRAEREGSRNRLGFKSLAWLHQEADCATTHLNFYQKLSSGVLEQDANLPERMLYTSVLIFKCVNKTHSHFHQHVSLAPANPFPPFKSHLLSLGDQPAQSDLDGTAGLEELWPKTHGKLPGAVNSQSIRKHSP